MDRPPEGGPAGTDGSRVRPARPADRERLLAVQRHLSRPNPDLLRAGLAGVGRCLVSVTPEDTPVGYLLALGRVAGPVADDTDEPPAPARREDADETAERGAYVAELVVAPAHRREGRATELLDALAADLAGGWITLTVAPGETAARAFYAARGFERLRREPAFFGETPALVLGRRV